jgi:hypothetical protein
MRVVPQHDLRAGGSAGVRAGGRGRARDDGGQATWRVANPEFLELAFPPRYHYDILRALDYFRAAGARPDTRMGEAVRLLQGKRPGDGRWLLERAYDETLDFPFGESVGEPSRWNTLRALRVLRWYEPRGSMA